MEYLNKFIEFLRKDTGVQNESTKLRYILRLILGLSILYNLIGSILNSFFAQPKGVIPFASFFFLFVFVFIISYVCSNTSVVVVFTHLVILSWVAFFVKCYGWGVGVQSVIIVPLMMGFFSGYKHNLVKVIYAMCLFAFRVILYYYSEISVPIIETTDRYLSYIQISNSLFAFIAISVIGYIYSRDSQALEGKLVEYNIQLVNQANTDPLTGLNNRRKTMEYLEALLVDSSINNICVSICDIDFFKNVNDSYGHDIGDKVLKSIAQTMVSCLGNECFISRWGGEEFLIVFPHINGDHAYVLLEELRSEIAKLTFEVKDRSFKITMTYGLSEYDYRSDVLSFIKEADNKLYYGKENGRDQVVF